MYRVILVNGTEANVGDLDTLRELANSGAISAASPIHDTKSGRTFPAGEHPFLRGILGPPPAPAHLVAQEAPYVPLQPNLSAHVVGVAEPTRRHHAMVWSLAGAALLVLAAFGAVQYISLQREAEARAETMRNLNAVMQSTERLMDKANATPVPR